MKTEIWYCWKEHRLVEGEETPRLLTPWSDPAEHEFAMDWLFASPEEARRVVEEQFGDPDDGEPVWEREGWVLVRMTLEPVVEASDGPT